MSEPSSKNDYLDQVMQQQQRVEVDLRSKRAPAPPPAAARQRQRLVPDAGASSGSSSAVEVRITGFWRWRNVLVPPNAYVVHNRRGKSEPLHLGLGISFGFNPYSDTFLVVPGTMQTILINAHCICKELQGLLVQGYVQWIVQDFGTAYKKLDFSDAEDPMRVVNVQLREQAEAAIKDKVATMSINEVLSDKQPIIEELTARLRHVAEGEGTDKGLGLRIITVQIKEAVVSSTRLWENLQKPFRAERGRVARLAELDAESVVQARELVQEKETQTTRLMSEDELSALRARHAATVFDREQSERARRHHTEQEIVRKVAKEQHDTTLAGLELEKQHLARAGEVQTLRHTLLAEEKRLENELTIALDEARRTADNRQAEREVELFAAKQRVQNELSAENLEARVIELLPVMAERMPKPDELRAISVGGDGPLANLVAQALGVLEALRKSRGENGKTPS